MSSAPTLLNLAPGGSLRPTGYYASTPQDVQRVVDAVSARADRRLTIHFHGGLVDEAAGVGVARRMARVYGDVSQPLTFVWETGLAETLGSSLGEIWASKLFQRVARVVIGKVARSLHVDATGRGSGAPLSDAEIDAIVEEGAAAPSFEAGARGAAGALSEQDIETAEAELQTELEAALAGEEAELEAAVDEALAAGAELPDDLRPAGRGARGVGVTLVTYVVKIAVAVLRRYVKKRDHGLWPTLVEEILRALYLARLGEWLWGRMKSSAEGMWGAHGGAAPEGVRGGRLLLERLAALDPRPTIDVVGHSAGSIAVCHMLDAIRSAPFDLRIRNVCFLAPACTHTQFASSVLASPGLFERLRMFTMLDANEARDGLVRAFPQLYPRSLLYLVSGAFEGDPDTPILGMERFLSGEGPYAGGTYDAVRSFFAERERLVLSETADGAGMGMRCRVLSHGGFDEDVLTLESLRHLVEGG